VEPTLPSSNPWGKEILSSPTRHPKTARHSETQEYCIGKMIRVI
jgi:hypothetical protein